MKTTYIPGRYLAICDVCGLRFYNTDLRKDWRGLMVDSACFETRHPQDFLRVPVDNPAVPWVRPEGEDDLILVCYVWERTSYAEVATADCARADNVDISYALAASLAAGN